MAVDAGWRRWIWVRWQCLPYRSSTSQCCLPERCRVLRAMFVSKRLCGQLFSESGHWEKGKVDHCSVHDWHIYPARGEPLLPVRCKSGWHSPPKSYCVFLALCVVRAFAKCRMENGKRWKRWGPASKTQMTTIHMATFCRRGWVMQSFCAFRSLSST